jgi:hypothetical protein
MRKFLLELALRANQLVNGLDHVDRNANGASLIGDSAGDSLPHPPRGISGELVAAAVIELVHRLHQADIAFLNEIEELQSSIGVALRYGNHQAQVGLDQLLFGGFRFQLAALDDLQRAAQLGGTSTAFFLQLLDALAALPQLLAEIARRMVVMDRFFELALDLRDFPLERL